MLLLLLILVLILELVGGGGGGLRGPEGLVLKKARRWSEGGHGKGQLFEAL